MRNTRILRRMLPPSSMSSISRTGRSAVVHVPLSLGLLVLALVVDSLLVVATMMTGLVVAVTGTGWLVVNKDVDALAAFAANVAGFVSAGVVVVEGRCRVLCDDVPCV